METSPAVDLAQVFVRNAIATGVLPQGGYLPPLGRLAKLAGVGSVTMWKALQRLRAEGLVAGVKGHPFIVLPSSTGPGKPVTPSITQSALEGCVSHTKSRRVTDRIEKDILNAVFPSGTPLPGIKELKARYGCSYPTLRKALDSLHDRSIIASSLHGYSVATVRPPLPYTRIIFIGYSWGIGEIVLSPIEEECLRMLELACVHGNMRLDIVYFSFENDRCVYRYAATGRPFDTDTTDDVLGYVYMLTGPDSLSEEVLSILLRGRKPLAIIDQVGRTAIPFHLLHGRAARVFRTGTTDRAPSLVAQFLSSLGHTRVTYISPFHGTQWSKLRLETLTRMLGDGESDCGVVPCTIDDVSSPIDFLPAARRRCDTSPLSNFYETLRRTQEIPFLEPVNPVKFNDNLRLILANCEVSLRCEELFERALSIPGVTAWVCANDYVAILAKGYLERNRIDVPEEISLLGFDDTRQAMKLGITSYNFNFQGVVTQVVNFIVRQTRKPAHKAMAVEVEGFLSQRHSTGPARKSPRSRG